MTLVLHRFPLGHFSEKARAALDFKGLEYQLVDHQPGPDQLALYRLSGQRNAPVLEHDGQVIHDATAIALHLERAFSARSGRRALLSDDIAKRREALDLAGRIDDVLGRHSPTLALDAAVRDRELFDAIARVALGLDGIALRAAHIVALASRAALAMPPGRRRVEEAWSAVEAPLIELDERLERSAFLLGESASLADVTAVGMALYLKFPQSRDLAVPSLAGRGVERLFGAPRHRRFFTWRDAFYREFLR